MTEPGVDAIIIGAGVIGNAVSFELAQRGWQTLSLDKGAGAGLGSTSSSGSIIRFSYSTPAGVMMAWEGMHYWKDWSNYVEVADESGMARFIQCGMATLAVGTDGHSETIKPLWDEVGVPYEEWTKDELAERYPLFDLGLFGPPSQPADDAFWQPARGELSGALFSPDSGYVDDPALAAHNLMVAAQAKGAEFRFNTTVVDVISKHGRCVGVELSDGTALASRVVVNVAGPHSAVVNRMAGLADTMNIATRPMRHEMHQVPGPKEYDFGDGGINVSDDDNGIYFRPHLSDNMLIGGTDPDCDEQEWVADPDEFNEKITDETWETHVLRANKRIPGLGVPHAKMGVVGLYDVSSDWIPIYDRTDLDGFYVAIGTSGNQFKNAAVAGHAMAELIQHVEDGLDHDAEPLEIQGRYTDCRINLGAFSRNREINQASSMSVHG